MSNHKHQTHKSTREGKRQTLSRKVKTQLKYRGTLATPDDMRAATELLARELGARYVR